MKSFTKSDLARALHARCSVLTAREAPEALDIVLRTMAGALARGVRVEVRSLGHFALSPYKARIGRNPKTGEPVAIPARYHPKFRLGKDLFRKLNGLK